jgi:ATP-dependent Lhr-like helicase
LTQGREVLQRYPQFHKLAFDEETGRYRLFNSKLAQIHRMSIGTIVSKESMNVVTVSRRRIGSIQENFISGLKKGDVFQFAGKKLELVMIKDMTAYVKTTTRPTNTIPSWAGGNLPISETLAGAFREILNLPHAQVDRVLAPVLRVQRRDSVLPDDSTLLIERLSAKEGEYLFVFPFEGRLVHEGIAHLWASRFAARSPSTFSFSVNDYGFQILGPPGYDFDSLFDAEFFSTDLIEEEIGLSLQMSELSKRQFRDLAQIAGLVFVGYPGSAKTGKQRQISASLLYEVFTKHEPGNLLIRQSFDEVLRGSLESERMKRALERLAKMRSVWKTLSRPSPLSFPLVVEFVASHLSNESLEAKVERLKRQWEKQAEIDGELSL